MFFDDRRMEDEQVDPEEIWSTIRYLDPDEKEPDIVGDTSTRMALLVLLIIIWAVWGMLWLKVREP
jgi:hypothetical protein